MKPRKNILLINPWIFDFAAYDFWAKPLGLLYLAGLLRKNGFAVRFVDCLNSKHPALRNYPELSPPKRKTYGQGKFPRQKISKPDSLRFVPRSYHRYGVPPAVFAEEILCGDKPDIILITSMMTYWYPGVFAVIRIMTEHFPGIPVVLGGNYVNFCPSHAVAHSGADFVLPGKAEKVLPVLFKSLLNEDFHFLPDPLDLDSYPYPAFDLLPFPDQVPILTSRGCPFRCTYCASHLLNPVFRRRNPRHVADEITYWNRTLGIRDFAIYDDAFLFEPGEMAVPLLKDIIRRGLKCRFHCPNGLHLRDINDDLASLLFHAGFATIRFGFETSDVGVQSLSGGKVTNADMMTAAQSLRRAGYSTRDIGVYILCGLPGQTSDEVRETILFVRSCGATPVVAEYSPIPGTDLWEDSVAVSPFPIEDEPLFQNNSLLPCRGSSFTYEDYRMLKKLSRDGQQEMK
jgi:radical SAM superfamily enzyme YgiQ (UPF0313 family)